MEQNCKDQDYVTRVEIALKSLASSGGLYRREEWKLIRAEIPVCDLTHFLLFYILLNKSATRNVGAIKVISAVVCGDDLYVD